ALDGNIYDHLKDYLMAFSRTELETCQAVQNMFQFLLETSSRSRQLESETGTTEEHSLNKEARKWATRVAREHKNIVHSQRTLEELECHGPVMSEQTRAELEQKIDEARESIRKAEVPSAEAEGEQRELEPPKLHLYTLWAADGSEWNRTKFQTSAIKQQLIVKLKAEARLDLLKQIGVSVDTWLKSAMNQVMEELENERWASLPSVTNNGSAHLASQPDELTIEEHEVLEVIEDGDMEDWVKFPTSSSLLSMLQSLAALDSRSHTSNNSTEADLVSGSINGDSSVCFVKALYDYEGQTDDELSFPEGAIIRILNKENQDDDGFWEGEFNGRVGVFPSVLVEELTASENGESQWIGDIQTRTLKTRQDPTRQDKTPQDKTRQDKTPQGKTPQGKTRQGKTPQDKTRQGKTPQGKTPQDKTRQGKTPQGKTRQDKARPHKTPQDETPQDKTRRDPTRQDPTRHDKTPQGKTRQDKARPHKARQDKARPHKARRDKARPRKARQDKTRPHKT
ncbi:hypothetical protein ASZ78_005419, partial [Callipepla squamata]